jgi:hypothetical protein
MVILGLVLGIMVIGASTLIFNTTGFEGCTFHIADAEGGFSLSTTDIIERIVRSNSGKHAWTVSTLERNWSVPFHFERCSINILIKLESGALDLAFLALAFNRRMNNPKNFGILILAQENFNSTEESLSERYITDAELFINFLDQHHSAFVESFVFCGRCQADRLLVKSPVSPTNLLEMKQFSEEIRNAIPNRTLHGIGFEDPISDLMHFRYCSIWYSGLGLSLSEIKKTGCDATRIFLQNLASRLNMTAKFASGYGFNNADYQDLNYTGSTPTGMLRVHYSSSDHPPPTLGSYVMDSGNYRFMYCR